MATFTKRIAEARSECFDWFYEGDSSWNQSRDLERIGSAFTSPDRVYSGDSMRFTEVTIPQGATILSAKITFTSEGDRSNKHLVMTIYGVDEDNTGLFSEVYNTPDTARTRTQTTAHVDWDQTFSTTTGNTFDTPDFTAVIQEIVDRAGWSSGNALAISIQNNGSPDGNYVWPQSFANHSASCALLTITYAAASASVSISASPSISPSTSIGVSASASPSVSPSITGSSSVSASPSISPSSSVSPSASSSGTPSISVSASPSVTPSASPSPFFGLRISEDGKNALESEDPRDYIFHSNYGTLKYFTKQSIETSFDANAGDIACSGYYDHNLGYYPYCEVYVRVYTGSTPTGAYEYCPFYGSGATVAYSANIKLTTTRITCYGMISGVSSDVWHFDFIVFIFKNNLLLS